jgi:tetratricopeptide (TPR) repeat protein
MAKRRCRHRPNPPKNRSDIESNEQLYLTGLHLEQYRHATYDPRPYYEEALNRDPGDSRCNNALGLWYLRRGQFGKAEKYFRTAVQTLTERNPNPIDGEPFFNLGLALLYQEKDEEAYGAFYKSVWNAAWQDSGYFQLARLAMKMHEIGRKRSILSTVRSIRNVHNHKARHLKVAILRKLERLDEARQLADESLVLDRFNFGVLFEKIRLNSNPDRAELTAFSGEISTITSNLPSIMRLPVYTTKPFSSSKQASVNKPEMCIRWRIISMPGFFTKPGWKKSMGNFENGGKASPDFCFPNQPEALMALTWAS